MPETTFIRKRDDMAGGDMEGCHGGVGAVHATRVLERPWTEGRHLQFLHDLIVPPAASVGVHRHTDDEEYYYFVSGRGTMILDGERMPVAAGDVTCVLPAGEHGLENDGGEALRVLVISVA